MSDGLQEPGEGAVGERPDEAPGAPARELEARLAATEDRLLRALAELDNQRKRMARDIEREREGARDAVLRSLLEVADSADRGLTVFSDREGDPVLAGLAAVAEQVDEVLRRYGVERMEAVGEPFDPERHEAVATTPAGDVADGAVAAVARTGYTVDGRLLRPAQVVVARGAGEAA